MSDDRLWPCAHRELFDDLWAMALAHLAELPAYEARVGRESALVGRDLEPWRALLAVALWLDDRGVRGLAAQMEALAAAYQAERASLETGDLTALVVRGLVRAVSAACAGSAVNRETPRALTLTTSSITRACKELVGELELDMDVEHVNVRRVGRVLGKMRWRAERTNRAKAWAVNLADLRRWTQAYGLEWPQDLMTDIRTPLPSNGTNGTSCITAPGAEGARPEPRNRRRSPASRRRPRGVLALRGSPLTTQTCPAA